MKTTNLWSVRWSIAKGWHWKYERDSLVENVLAWLVVLQKNEPNVFFAVSEKMPSKRELSNVVTRRAA